MTYCASDNPNQHKKANTLCLASGYCMSSMMGLKEIEWNGVNWINLALEDRNSYWAVVITVMNL